MRFPRLFAFYRSYPEFDGYSDEQCRKLVLQARLRRGDAAWVMPLLAALGLMVAWTIFGGGLLVLIASMAGRNLPPFGTFLTPIFLFEIPGFIVAYVWVRRIMLVRSIRRLINRAVCPFCEFSLVGLPVKVNAVICPECGQKVQLTAHGIRREDLDVDAPDVFAPPTPPSRTPSKPVSPLGRGR
jgi:hypothetical protein